MYYIISSSDKTFSPVSPVSGSASAPIAIACEGSGSGLLSLRSLYILTVVNGEDDHMIQTHGNDGLTNLC